jgi:hypothetical protein
MYGFHRWIPELEFNSKFLYTVDTNRCFKIASTGKTMEAKRGMSDEEFHKMVKQNMMK